MDAPRTTRTYIPNIDTNYSQRSLGNGIGPDDMKSIAKIIKLMVSNTILQSSPNADKPSKPLHVLDVKVRDEIRQ